MTSRPCDDAYPISTDKARLDLAFVHGYLSEQSYWAKGRSLDVVRRSIANSLCFGVYHETGQVGFARVVTDGATFGWLCDVFIIDGHRGHGLGKRLVTRIVTDPEVASLQRLLLGTRDAHTLYATYGGFTPLDIPERWMIRRPENAPSRSPS